MPNQVTLTFAGDPAGAKNAFAEVDDSARKMTKSVDEASEGWGRAGEAADEVDTKAMGFRDTLTGVQDTMGGVALISKGDLFNGFLTLGAGIGDLGSGFYNLIIPALAKTKVATLAQAAATNIASGATKAFTLAQRLLSTAFLTSPIGWIVLAVGALVAVVVLIATKTDWFQKLWRNSWAWIKNAAQNTWNFLKQIPGWIGTAFSKVANFILAPYKAAFNGIARAWNATVGRLSFTVPGWVPVIGGNTFSVPKLPTLHSGGIVPGVVGTPTPIMALAGERVSGIASRGGGMTTVSAGDALIRELLELIAREVGRAGGDASTLGIRIA